MTFDFLIIGGGIIGITVARELASHTKGTIAIAEKEPDIARHASGRNSGVLHAGFYYTQDSLKAKLCREGNQLLREYCKGKKLKIKECGKVVVTKSEKELESLEELARRGTANGVNIQLIDENELKEIEPRARTFQKALHSPSTAVVDPEEVCRALLLDAEAAGVQLFLNTRVIGCIGRNTVTTGSCEISFHHVINCAGAYADRVAHFFDGGHEFKMLPFKGTYYELKKEKNNMIRTNIYPVPDLKFPFLGVHFTKTVDGSVLIGPTATPALGRENYKGFSGINFKEILSLLPLEAKLFLKNSSNFRNLAFEEMKRYFKSRVAREMMQMAAGIREQDIVSSAHSGIRAQLVHTKTGKLEMDFIIEHAENSTHILNAVSPAFTCSLPFARHVVDQMKKRKIL